MRTFSLLAPWIRRFLLEHLISDRNLAHNTQRSYRDTLVLFLPFVANKTAKSIDLLTIENVRADIVRRFLLELEQQRGCSISTRNQRLAAIHALARFIGERSPDHIAWLTEIRSIPFKKTSNPTMAYLEKHEMDALLNAPDRRCSQGIRDHALFYSFCTTRVPGLRRLRSLLLQIWISALLPLSRFLAREAKHAAAPYGRKQLTN
jgi:integrase/recombinase XerD